MGKSSSAVKGWDWKLDGDAFSFQGFPLELTSTQPATHGCLSML